MRPEAGEVVDSLSSAVHGGEHSLSMVPRLLRRVLTDGLWREFVTVRSEHVQHERFDVFVTTPPTHGLGASMELIERIIGTDDPELLRLLREAKKGKPGRPKKDETRHESCRDSREETALTADRLAREAPDEYEAVQRGEKTLNAAARAAGIRKPRVMIRLDDPESAARTLAKHMDAETRARLKELL